MNRENETNSRRKDHDERRTEVRPVSVLRAESYFVLLRLASGMKEFRGVTMN